MLVEAQAESEKQSKSQASGGGRRSRGLSIADSDANGALKKGGKGGAAEDEKKGEFSCRVDDGVGG